MRVSSTGPGSTTLTVMPRGPSSWARYRANCVSAALAVRSRDHALPGMAAEAGTEIADASPALFSHGEQNGFGDRERRTHLVVELATQFFPRHVLERLDHIRGERVVHKYVDATPCHLNLLDHALDRSYLAHVGLHGHSLSACGLDAGYDLLGCRAAVEVVDHYAHPSRGQKARGGRTDSAGTNQRLQKSSGGLEAL